MERSIAVLIFRRATRVLIKDRLKKRLKRVLGNSLVSGSVSSLNFHDGLNSSEHDSRSYLINVVVSNLQLHMCLLLVFESVLEEHDFFIDPIQADYNFCVFWNLVCVVPDVFVFDGYLSVCDKIENFLAVA